jgi:hypothetical protein
MTNVNGNWKKEQIVKGKGWRLGSRTRLGMRKTKEFITKKKIKHGAQFTKYAGPTVGMFKKTGAAALGVGKFALKRGALGFPGLAATGLYYGGKKFAKTIAKRDRGLQWASYRQYNKKGRKII